MASEADRAAQLARLQHALGERYRVEAEVGTGGSANVYRAFDYKLERNVAVKVLHAELAATIARDRFVREIHTSSGLTHPNVLPLFDAGESDGLLYYTMPLVEAESLAERLQREGTLPVEEAVRITRAIASALRYAHERGIVHRDIKPANVLLPADEVAVADFGIAHALGDTGDHKLTATGVGLGTPLYMSPEQAFPSGPVDARSDLYGLGCVLYEMLAGCPPFSGPTNAAVLARHALDGVPSLRNVRDTVPPQLDAVVTRCLAKLPADRFQTADELIRALESAPVQQSAVLLPPRIRGWKAGVAAALAVSLPLVLLRPLWRARTPPLDESVIATVPFEVSGTADSVLSADLLRLLDAGFTGEGGPRSVERVAISNLLPAKGGELGGRQVQRIAQRAGAGLSLRGSLFVNGDRITANAVVADAASGDEKAVTADITGARSDVKALADRLVAELLIRLSNQPARQLPALLATPLPALRAYLGGLRAMGRGRYRDAIGSFDRALAADSSFTHAAMALSRAGRRLEPSTSPYIRDRGISAAVSGGPVAEVDSLFLRALVGPFPAPYATAHELRAWEFAAEARGAGADAWIELGNLRMAWGHVIQAGRGSGPAANAFETALRLEPGSVPALEGLIEARLFDRDTVGLRKLRDDYNRLEPPPDLRRLTTWRIAALLDGKAVPALPLDSLDTGQLQRLVGFAQIDGVQLRQARLALAELERRATGVSELGLVATLSASVALNAGRSRDAARFQRPLVGGRITDVVVRVLDAEYWGGDTTGIDGAIDNFDRLLSETPWQAPPGIAGLHCAVGLWRLHQGRIAEARRAAAALDSVPEPLAQPATTYLPLCARMIAVRADEGALPDSASRSLARLESLARLAYPGLAWVASAASLVAASAHERLGDPAAALRAIQRRPREPSLGIFYLSTSLHEEGKLALQAGDPETAIRAWQHYLALRPDPQDDAARVETAAIRRELGRLLAGANRGAR